MTEDKTGFRALFEDFAQKVNAPDLKLNEDGEAMVIMGEDLVVNVHYNEDRGEILVYSIVADMDVVEDREGLLERMMRANFFWIGSEGFTLSLDSDSDRVLVIDRRNESYFIDADMFATYLDMCASVVTDWRREILAAGPQWPEDTDSTDDSPLADESYAGETNLFRV